MRLREEDRKREGGARQVASETVLELNLAAICTGSTGSNAAPLIVHESTGGRASYLGSRRA